VRLEDSPFRSGWWGTDLGEVRHRGAIIPPYGCYDFSDLPAIPYRLSGSFDWLSDARPQSRNIGEQRSKENATAFVQLQSICELKSILLPAAFTKLFSTPSLQQRIRSNTDCFLDLCPNIVPSPVGNGYLIRFLADSQGCVFWYVYLSEGGLDHALFHRQIFTASRPSIGMTQRLIHQRLFFAPSPLSPFSVVFGSKMKSGLPNMRRLRCQKRGGLTSNDIRAAHNCCIAGSDALDFVQPTSVTGQAWSFDDTGLTSGCPPKAEVGGVIHAPIALV
jgi:hypothetical protein